MLLVVLGRRCLCSDVEELDDDLERESLGLGHLDVDEDEREAADDGVEAEDPGEADGAEHDGQRVGDGDVPEPEGEGADGDAEAPDAGGEDLGAEDVGDGAEAHDEAAEINDDTDCGEHSMGHCTQVNNIGYNQDN